MVTDEQVRLLRQKRMDGKSQEAAAAAAGMSVRTARKWESGALPAASKRGRSWRTRRDPFEGVWDEEIVPLLVRDADRILQATTLLELLDGRYPGRFGAGQVRTLQRRIRDWRAVHGPEREVYFEQTHPPGREAQLDFTHGTELGVRIAGEAFDHLLFEFVLSFSGWRWVCLAFGETFEALVNGLQGALWELGGVPEIARSDNLSAATHELKRSGGRALNERFAAVLAHYGLRSTRIQPRLRDGRAVRGLRSGSCRPAEPAHAPAAGRGTRPPSAPAVVARAQLHGLPRQGAQVEHDPDLEQDLLGAFAPARS
jgi:hypothetical protein